MSLINKEFTQFAVIGLGRFGSSLTKALNEENVEVLAIDCDADKVNAISDFCTHSAITDASDEECLRSLGIGNFDVAIICVGNNMQTSVLATLACKELNVPVVICKAKNKNHKKILEKLGADLVVVPEDDMAAKLAIKLTNPLMHDVMELTNNFSIAEIEVPHKWADKTLIELDLRKRYGIIVLLVKDGDKITASPGGDCKLEKDTSIIIGGDPDAIKKLTEKLAGLR